MTGEEIRKAVDTCYQKIESSFDPTNFVLNNLTLEMNLEVSRLQTLCKHEFVDGKCKYCDFISK